MATIKNGMTVKVRDDIEVPEKLKSLHKSGRGIKLEDSPNSSMLLQDDIVMIKGIGYFKAETFEEYIDDEEETHETYELIIHTQNVFEQGGAYQTYSSVYEHHEEAHGVRVVTTSGEWFHPWSYDGGIRAVFVPA